LVEKLHIVIDSSMVSHKLDMCVGSVLTYRRHHHLCQSNKFDLEAALCWRPPLL